MLIPAPYTLVVRFEDCLVAAASGWGEEPQLPAPRALLATFEDAFTQTYGPRSSWPHTFIIINADDPDGRSTWQQVTALAEADQELLAQLSPEWVDRAWSSRVPRYRVGY